ncbi:plastocyanin/azurin family copper-binding protein [Nitrosopumilus sp.]|uniref:plastocyanin/azurin family copper-binding protein n=1 Tax=Nitrosopumilus sp. TaxID=2024843 RepID=UPI00247F0091|nr:plastocyanin/azurin family copper-binding protein [Nitrosopumilus sp.]MCV0410522.1 multicopper oxidase domain-containing protein [Nitrosopumilus sp.]
MKLSHDNSQVYRTTPARTGKMMIIMLGICIVGGVIFFSMWDYWISQPAPVVGMMSETIEHDVQAAFTGVHIPVTLSFIESSDFRTLAFNALPGEPDNNPTINADVGDEINFSVINNGKSFHSFGVTKATEGFSGIIPGSEVASASNPLKPGEGGDSKFIPGEEGTYYYICTVPGHREQGMVGKIVVGDVPVEEVMETEPEVMEEVMEATPEPEVMEEVAEPEPVAYDGVISIPDGSSVPGCEETYECYIPYHVTVSAGDEITWSNDDSAAHTVTSGTPSDGPDGNFDSSLFMAGNTFSVTLDEAGEYPYFCMVHPWMVGIVTVN